MRRKKKKEIVYSSKVKRFSSFVIDYLVLYFIVIKSFNSVIMKIVPDVSLSNISSIESTSITNIAMIIGILMIIYFSYMQYKWGQTIGQMIMKIKINENNIYKIIISNLIFIPIMPFAIFWIVDPIYLMMRGNRLIDKWLNINVIDEEINIDPIEVLLNEK